MLLLQVRDLNLSSSCNFVSNAKYEILWKIYWIYSDVHWPGASEMLK